MIDTVDDPPLTLIIVRDPLSRDNENDSLESSNILSSLIIKLVHDDLVAHRANVSVADRLL